jgi:predicted DNA-binding transcriptional regulator AlpA
MNDCEISLKISPVKRTKDSWEYLGLSRSAFLKLVALGHLPRGIKLTPNGRAVCWRTADLDAYLKSRGV